MTPHLHLGFQVSQVFFFFRSRLHNMFVEVHLLTSFTLRLTKLNELDQCL